MLVTILSLLLAVAVLFWLNLVASYKAIGRKRPAVQRTGCPICGRDDDCLCDPD